MKTTQFPVEYIWWILEQYIDLFNVLWGVKRSFIQTQPRKIRRKVVRPFSLNPLQQWM